MMKDRLVFWMNAEKIQQKLPQETGLTFEKAVKIVVANKNLKQMNNPVSPNKGNVNKVIASKDKHYSTGKPDQKKYMYKRGSGG